MWMMNIEFRGIIFHVLGEWPGPEGMKLCLAMTDETLDCLNQHAEDVADGFRYLIDRRQELEWVGWAGDGVAWDCLQNEHNPDELKHIVETILASQFADDSRKRWASSKLPLIEALKQKQAQKIAKQSHIQRRRGQFMKDYDRLMLALIERDGYRCAECGTVEDLTIDHITPLSKGGSDELDNLQLLCRQHNSSKCDHLPK